MPLAPALVPPALLPKVQSAVLEWYASHARDLSFRRTKDPWAVLVSEVMAQQTQAARAADHWTRFMARFPTPGALASATPADVIREWRGLGYNRRAVALRTAAVRMVEQHAGEVPDRLEPLEALPGVGPYTARAVLAFAFDRPIAPLDTNVRRVLERALGPLPAPPRALQSTADAIVPAGASAAWSHALMDIGATLCVAAEPRCGPCPIRAWCRTSLGDRDASLAGRPTARRPKPTETFPATTRWLRGRILDRLRDADDGRWVDFRESIGQHPTTAVTTALDRLDAEGMIERPPTEPSRARLRDS